MDDAMDQSEQSGPDVLDFDAAFEQARQAMLKAGIVEEVEGEPEGESLEDLSDDNPGEEARTGDEQPADDEDDDDEGDTPGEGDDADADPGDDDADVSSVDGSETAPELDASDPTEGDESTEPEPSKKTSRRGKAFARLESKNRELEAEVASIKEAMEANEQKLIERLRNEQRLADDLAKRQREREAEDERIAREVNEYLGNEEEYRESLRAALNGDFDAADRVKAWDANRERHEKIQARAESVVKEKAARVFAQATADLPGLDPEVIGYGSLYNVVRHLYITGLALGRGESVQEIDRLKGEHTQAVEKLNAKVARLEGQLSAAKVQRVGQEGKTTPSNGRSVPAAKPKSKLEGLMGPDGYPTDEALEAVRTGKIKLLAS